ncbi:MAG: PEP-CTERM sorting domain-containing protein [Planctomycetota bacterium]|nr:PEP-CTERM sorting domain-containing protein [Planctomycetota bacterium]
MRVILFCLIMLGGLSQSANAATISAVLNLNTGASNPGQASYGPTVQDFGAIVDAGSGVGVPPSNGVNGGVVSLIPDAFVSLDANTKAHVGADARRLDPASTQNVQIYLTTYAYFQVVDANAVTSGADYSVTNRAHWDFQVNGNYNWSISDQIPQFTGAKRTFSFEKIGAGGSVLASDNVGSGGTNPSGTLGSGTYRLFYTHTNSDYAGTLLDPTGNPRGSTNLNIFFTFQSEDSSGVVPEPTSVAVFGLLGIGSAIAKWRRKK